MSYMRDADGVRLDDISVATRYPNVTPSGDDTGVTDTATIQANEDAGLNTVLQPGATYYVKGLVKKSNCAIYVNDATIELPHGANTDVIVSENFATLTGTLNTGGIFNAGIYGPGEINGTKFWSTLPVPTTVTDSFNMSASFSLQLSSTAGLGSTGAATVNTQSGPQAFTWSANNAGTNTLTCSSTKTGRVLSGTKVFTGGYGIRLYGYNLDIGGNLRIRECVADGVWTEWHPSASVGSTTPEMESRLGPFKAYENGRNGYSYLGPHDSYVNHVVAFRNQAKGIVATNGSIGYFTNCHGWGSPQVVSLEDHTGSTWVDCVGEMTSATSSRGWGIWSNQTVTRGCIALWAGSGGNVGLEIENNASGCDIDMKFVGGFGNGAVKFTNDGGGNIIRGVVNGLAANPMIAGTPHATDIIDLIPGVTTSTPRYTQNVATLDVLNGKVDQTTTVNGHALSSNVVVSASDITTGTLPTSVLPDLAITDVTVVADQAAMLALSAQQGDVAIRLDNSKTYILSTNSPSTLADWKELTAAGAVTSVNGQTGTVALVKGDVGLGSVDNTSDTDKPVSTLQAAAIADVQNDIDTHEADTANPHSVTKAQVGLGSVDNTADANKPLSTPQAAAISTPKDHGFAGWAFDPAGCASQTAPASGAIKYIRIKAIDTRNVTQLMVGVGSAGSSLTSGQCLLGLYDDTGTRLAVSGDQSTAWTTTGNKIATISSTAVTAGSTYYIGILAVGSTPPSFARGFSASATVANAGYPTAPFRFNSGATGQTALPSSFTPSGTTAELAYWVGMS